MAERIDWNNLPHDVLECMKWLGHFGPTVNAENRELKGYMLDPDDGEGGKVYLTSDDLRALGAACIAAADWLDARAQQPPAQEPQT